MTDAELLEGIALSHDAEADRPSRDDLDAAMRPARDEVRGRAAQIRRIAATLAGSAPTPTHEQRLAVDEAIRVYENGRGLILGDETSRLLDSFQQWLAALPYTDAAPNGGSDTPKKQEAPDVLPQREAQGQKS